MTFIGTVLGDDVGRIAARNRRYALGLESSFEPGVDASLSAKGDFGHDADDVCPRLMRIGFFHV